MYLYRQEVDADGVVVSEELVGQIGEGFKGRQPSENLGSVSQFVRDAGIPVRREGNSLIITGAPPASYWAVMDMLDLTKPCDIPGCDKLRKEFRRVLELETSRQDCPSDKQDCVERAVRRKFFSKAKALWQSSSLHT